MGQRPSLVQGGRGLHEGVNAREQGPLGTFWSLVTIGVFPKTCVCVGGVCAYLKMPIFKFNGPVI